MIYTTYAPDTDITFIMEDIERPDGSMETRVMGFYYGAPDEESTEKFYGSLKVVY